MARVAQRVRANKYSLSRKGNINSSQIERKPLRKSSRFERMVLQGAKQNVGDFEFQSY
jgi:hypothetical protein